LCTSEAIDKIAAMATRAPRLSFGRLFFEPLEGPRLFTAGILVWLAGAGYCHGYQALLNRENIGTWSGSLTWSAVAVVPWFALFEWSKQPRSAETTRRPMYLLALIVGIAGVSIALEYVVNFCVGDVSDRLGLLVMRRLPAIGVTILLIALTRKAMLRRPPAPAATELIEIAASVDWIEAADNYVEVHVGSRVLLMRMTLQAAEQKLRAKGFVRIHRRYLVNEKRVDAVLGTNGDRRVRIAGIELPVGSRFAASLSSRLDRARPPATT
jgi:hypothetical protein